MSSAPDAGAATPYGTLPPASPPSQRKPLSLPRLADMHARGEKITMLTAYDATSPPWPARAAAKARWFADPLAWFARGLPGTAGGTREPRAIHTGTPTGGAR